MAPEYQQAFNVFRGQSSPDPTPNASPLGHGHHGNHDRNGDADNAWDGRCSNRGRNNRNRIPW
jgi:hypothetical protein